MTETFKDILSIGGNSNALGKTDDVIKIVLEDKTRFSELYSCVFDDNAWVRMRAIDAVEKIGRVNPAWLLPYIDTFQSELAAVTQPSILWHLAQIYRQIELSDKQRVKAKLWLGGLLATTEIDWIVAANTMKTLVYFAENGYVSVDSARSLIEVQLNHKSNTVIRTAKKLLLQLSSSAH